MLKPCRQRNSNAVSVASILSGKEWVAFGSLVLLTLAGCARTGDLQTSYGKVTRTPSSINGLSKFAEELRGSGVDVEVRSRISPSIENFDVIIWCPDSTECPEDEAVDALNEWLLEGWGRTLVYVGGHYRSDRDYYQAAMRTAPPDEREEYLRRRSEAILQGNAESYFWIQPRTSCAWFEQEELPPRSSARLGGDWVQELNPRPQAELQITTLLKPVDESLLSGEPRVLLTVDGETLAYEVTLDDFSESRMIVLSNAEFLVNFGMVDPEKRRLTQQLVSELKFSNNALILESGPGPIPVSDSDYVNHNQWAWIAEAPLRYIVPHFLAWGTLVCFVMFPIFGRPRRARRQSSTSFRNHVNAVGKQLSRTGQPGFAQEEIRHFHEMADKKS